MPDDTEMEVILKKFDDASHDLKIFMRSVSEYIGEHPALKMSGQEIVHSYKSRLKNREHLRKKIERKTQSGKNITPENFFSEVTDLAGVRILHLFQQNFLDIDKVIRYRVEAGDWFFGEAPKAYTWDPEIVEFFQRNGLEVSQKSTSYTSVHYLIRPRADSPICCELQVRTLFEEIWGEVDHQINYPLPNESISCREQIKVLSKIVGAGSRLLDSIKRIQEKAD